MVVNDDFAHAVSDLRRIVTGHAADLSSRPSRARTAARRAARPGQAVTAPLMLHEDTLIATLALSLAFAFAFGLLAVRLKLPPLVGYLLAGIALSPYTPGWVADVHLAPQLAEIGVMLLMFGVGTHFSLRDLMAVKGIAIPGAVAQIAVATALGALAAHLWGWSLGAGLCSALRSRSPAPWRCCARSSSAAPCTRTTGALQWAGSWWRTW